MNADPKVSRSSREEKQIPADWLIKGGETSGPIRSMDWSATPLGTRDTWPQNLRTAVNFILTSNYPMAILWGSELIIICNDGYKSIVGDRHPMVMGRSIRDVWSESLEFRKPLYESVMARGESQHLEDQLFRIARHGCIEDAYFTISYIPIHADDNRIDGALVLLTETTQSVLLRKQLQENEERFRSLTEHAVIGFYRTTPDGHILLANSALRRMLGYSSLEELTQRNLEQDGFEPGYSRAEFKERLARDGEVIGLESAWTRRDGAPLFVRENCRAIRDVSGRIQYYDGSVEDITEHKLAEMALRDSEEQYRVLFDSAGDAIFIHDMQGCMQAVNCLACERLGYTQQELMSMNLRQLDAPEDVHQMPVRLAQLMEHGQLSFEVVHLRKDGSCIPTEVSAKRVLWQGQPAIMTICRDITERKRAEEARRESEAQHRSLFENMLEGFAYCQMIFADGRPQDLLYLEVNNAFSELTGLEDVVGRKITEVLPGIKEANPELLEIYGRVALTGKPERFENYFEPLKAWLSISVYSPEKGYFVAVFDNITERKRGEEALRESESKFKGFFEQSNVGMSITRLSGEMQVNQALCDMLGYSQAELQRQTWKSITHPDDVELTQQAVNMLLSGKQNSVRLIKRFLHKTGSVVWTDLSTKLRRDEVGQPLYLIATVIDITERKRAEEEKAKLESQLHQAQKMESVGRLAGGVAHDFNNMLGVILGHAELALNQLDPGQIDQILANLCINARDAIQGIGKITIGTGNCTLDEGYCAAHTGSVPGEYVLLTASDDGRGMDKETLAQIFEPFFTTKVIGKGTGLGLATVYGIVKQNNGFINVYSEPGHGSTFSIYLPRYVDKTERATGTKGVVQRAKRGHETILLVEDEPAILKLTKRMIEKQGYTVLAASTPGEAIRLAKEYGREIHLLMTDVVMPEMNGRDLAKKMLSICPHISRLFASGYTSDVIADHGVLDEGVYFIQKPFTTQSLATKVREVLDQA